MQRCSILLTTSLSALLFCFAGLFFHAHAHAKDASTAVSWEALCAVLVCPETGHDGVFAARFSPDYQQLAICTLA
jgi:hypothetical protein